MKIKFVITLFFIAIIAYLLCEESLAQGTWTKKKDFPTSSRYYGLGFSIGKKGYFGMGQKQVDIYSYKVYTDFWEYDSEKNTWTQKSDFAGDGRIGAKGFCINDKIYVGLGYVIAPNGPNAGSNDYLTDLYEFDPSTNKWSKKNNAYLGGSDVGFVIRDTMYSVNLEDRIFKKYNTATDSWTENKWQKKALAPNYAEIIGNGTSFSVWGKACIITCVKKKGNYINQLWELDPHTITWNQKNDLPVPGNDTINVFYIGEKGYVLKGSNVFLEYDPASDTWAEKKEISAPNKNFSPLFTIGDKSYGFCKHEFWEFAPL